MRSLTLTVLSMGLCCLLSSHSYAAETAKTMAEPTQKVTKTIDKKSSVMQKVNINKASAEELQSLKGIGQAKAKAIVDYRTKNGKFTDLQQLTMVSGIGEKLVSQNTENMSF
ncbi:ComEA family DNA-binding protein [Shewanella livingstonensis]|uniref:Helix-hairpin-helix domain-containing protein n=1 Tax=Shewanella livingstonensis TaxID=150120 RepID=A0A3G8LT31_9GAMM|nr:helix-hairpin-helix domain-containing protein [Shewanella livingstonensis]AZG72766.1 helix-hairpin-helix domain-containing protein [Shewanella livingstonensis]